MMFAECCECDEERYEFNCVCDDCLRSMRKLKLDRVKAKRNLKEKVWAVIDLKYGIVGLYATKRLATKACDEGIGLNSGFAGTVRSMMVRKSIEA